MICLEELLLARSVAAGWPISPSATTSTYRHAPVGFGGMISIETSCGEGSGGRQFAFRRFEALGHRHLRASPVAQGTFVSELLLGPTGTADLLRRAEAFTLKRGAPCTLSEKQALSAAEPMPLSTPTADDRPHL